MTRKRDSKPKTADGNYLGLAVAFRGSVGSIEEYQAGLVDAVLDKSGNVDATIPRAGNPVETLGNWYDLRMLGISRDRVYRIAASGGFHAIAEKAKPRFEARFGHRKPGWDETLRLIQLEADKRFGPKSEIVGATSQSPHNLLSDEERQESIAAADSIAHRAKALERKSRREPLSESEKRFLGRGR